MTGTDEAQKAAVAAFKALAAATLAIAATGAWACESGQPCPSSAQFSLAGTAMTAAVRLITKRSFMPSSSVVGGG